MPSFSGALRRLERRLTSTSRWVEAERFRLVRRAAATEPDPDAVGHLLLPTVGLGNIGDQAMFEAVLRNVPGPITAVLQTEDSHTVPPTLVERVSTVVLPHLYTGRPTRVRHDRHQLVELMTRHRSVGVIGADIMDGGYDRREATTRFSFLSAANQLGLDTRIYGFSWNGSADHVVTRALRSTQPGTRLFLRDPHSLSRVLTLAEHAEPAWQAQLAADIVFSLPSLPAHSPSSLAAPLEAEPPLAVVNVSGLVMAGADLTDDHVAVVHELLGLGCQVVLLPHVIRPGDDDAAACRHVMDRLAAEPGVRMIDQQLSPSEVGQLTARAKVVFTGRMHLAILALSQEVPAVVLSTQGKVSGLLELFDLGELGLDPVRGFAVAAAPLLRQAVSSADLADRARNSLPRVRTLSVRNFDGLRG